MMSDQNCRYMEYEDISCTLQRGKEVAMFHYISVFTFQFGSTLIELTLSTLVSTVDVVLIRADSDWQMTMLERCELFFAGDPRGQLIQFVGIKTLRHLVLHVADMQGIKITFHSRTEFQ